MNRKRSDKKMLETAAVKRGVDDAKLDVLRKEATEAKNPPINEKTTDEVEKVVKDLVGEGPLDAPANAHEDDLKTFKLGKETEKIDVGESVSKESDLETVVSAAPPTRKTAGAQLESGMEYATTFASHKQEQSATEDKSQFPASKEYLEQLFQDKEELSRIASFTHTHFRHVIRLVDKEIKRAVEALSAKVTEETPDHEEDLGRRVMLSEAILVPVDKYPEYNFVGRILGPRGMTAKQLEEETGCKIMVRGRGSSRSFHAQRNRDRSATGDAEPLHVVIICEDYEKVALAKMNRAVEAINQILNPPPEGKDEFKRKQLVELSIINGTYRPTSGTKSGHNSPPPPTANGLLHTPLDHHHSDSSRRIASYMENNRKLMGGVPMSGSDASTSVEDQYAQMVALQRMNMQMSNPAFLFGYYKQLLSVAMSDPTLLNALLAHETAMANGMQSTRHHSQSGVPQANLQQYMTAAAMLRSAPDARDGSGDWERSNQ